MENDLKSPSFQLIDTLFLLFYALGFFVELLGLCFFEPSLLEVTGSLLDTLFVLFYHPTQGVLLLLVELVLETTYPVRNRLQTSETQMWYKNELKNKYKR